MAVLQHDRIVALNAAAHAAGVRAQTPPADAQRLLLAVGGALVPVHAQGSRVSYAPYRAASARLAWDRPAVGDPTLYPSDHVGIVADVEVG